MELVSIKGDAVTLIYHPTEAGAEVGLQVALKELPEKEDGIIAQVIASETLEYDGLAAEMIQRILETRLAQTTTVFSRETGMDAIKSLKVAKAKIRKRIVGGEWRAWDGWIPSRNVAIEEVSAKELLRHILPEPVSQLRPFVHHGNEPVAMDGPRLDGVSVVTGIKGSGKSHFAKGLITALSECRVPCVVLDFNGEYDGLRGAQVLRWKEDFRLRLGEVGWPVLAAVVRSIYPFQAGSPSEAVWENTLPKAFKERRTRCAAQGMPYDIDVDYLQSSVQWSTQQYVAAAIAERLDMVADMGLFAGKRDCSPTLADIYEASCAGNPAVFSLRHLGVNLQGALAKAVTVCLERLSEDEALEGTGRHPYLIADEAQEYIRPDAILGLVTRARHLGISSIFVSNSPESLPEQIWKLLDNLCLLPLTHDDDIRAVGKTSVADRETVEALAKRLPRHHALVCGNITSNYPLVVGVDPLPDDVRPGGETRSTWTRLVKNG